jgi:hypothetical protein
MVTAKQKTTQKGKTKDVKKPAADPSRQKTRRLKKPTYASFRLQKSIKRSGYRLPGSWFLLRRSVGTLQRRWKLFLGIALVYALLTILLVRGLAGFENVGDIKDFVQESFGDGSSTVLVTTSTLVYLLGSTGSTNGSDANIYQALLFILASLATIWALRQAYAVKVSETIRIRDSFYRGMNQLIPFILVLLVIIVEFIPLAIGSFLYTTVVNGGIAVTGLEQLLWAFVLGLTAVLSFYLVLSTIFALYVVALPDMTPMHAMRSARGLVRHRRVVILGRLLMLALYWLVSVSILMIPVIALIPSLASWIFFAVTMVSLVFVHSYLYALYRELLHD